MKHLSFLLLSNSLGLKMKKGFKNFCSGDGSTSTLNQQKAADMLNPDSSSLVDSPFVESRTNHHQPTLEEMIMQLDLEEKMARRAKLEDYGDFHHRMSCVNSSDILRSAQNALNQYPRFSLDGKDAMYRSSFRSFDHVTGSIRNRKSVNHGRWLVKDGTSLCLPAKVAGERVIWCKPGVVGKLMGLEAMPIPIRLKHRMNSSIPRKQNLRSSEIQEMERRKLDGNHGGAISRRAVGSCSKSTTRYCVTKPVAVEIANDEAGWPMRRFL